MRREGRSADESTGHGRPHPRLSGRFPSCGILRALVAQGGIVTLYTTVALVAGIGAWTSPARAADPPAREFARHAVAAAEPRAAEVGAEILAAGGNAVDAAVAVGFALAVTYPVAGNLGGGGFLVAVLPDEAGGSTRVALDFREVAPAAAHRDLYREAERAGREEASTLGHLAVAVPGSVAGLLHALERWGTLEREQVLAPAIRLAEDGFALPRRTHRFLATPRIATRMKRFSETRRIFYPHGEPLHEGVSFRQPDLAKTLRRIAREGRAGFYDGPLADAIAAEMERGGGIITREDLRSYRPVERDPICFGFRDLTVVTMPPPSSGGVCLQQMLGVLAAYPLENLGHNSSATLHLLAEAMRRSFADRNRALGDPDQQSLPLGELLSPQHIEAMRRTIDPRMATPSREVLAFAAPGAEGEQTTHYSVVDARGGAVAVTTTLNGAFGAKIVVPGTGVLLNNEMDDFAARPGEPNLYGLVQGERNAVAPGRRPLSSMTPTVLTDASGRVRAVLGTPGGPTIITNVLQVILNLTVFGLEPQAAVNAAKVHHQCLPDRLDFEAEIPADVREGLRRRGHQLRERTWIGDVQLIVRDPDTGRLLGASDPRGGGAVRGEQQR